MMQNVKVILTYMYDDYIKMDPEGNMAAMWTGFILAATYDRNVEL
jgi:hypothetical protein